MTEVLAVTESVCPVCLQRIPAARVQEGDQVYLQKSCPQHGEFRAVIWRGEPGLAGWVRPKTPSYPAHPAARVERGCPQDCGLCPDHRQHTCSALLEVTLRCDLNCPVCFASANSHPPEDWSLERIAGWYRAILDTGTLANIQLSGGEPCLRDDLPQIIQLGRDMGFTYFQVNTNGLRLARDPAYLARLKEAGLSSVFLQFDGSRDDIYRQIRGRNLFREKMTAIENCAEAGLGVVLVTTLVPGINTADIGGIVRLGLAYLPYVRGVHFQPISYFGRYPAAPADMERITLPEVMRAIEEQTDGLIRAANFAPPGCENALCSFHGNFVLMPDGKLKALTHRSADACGCQPLPAAAGAAQARKFVAQSWSAPLPPAPCAASGPGLGEWDVFLERKRTHAFCISCMAFQDAWTLDLERLRDCCIHTVSPDGRLIPFCAYNLTSCQGVPLYRAYESHPA